MVLLVPLVNKSMKIAFMARWHAKFVHKSIGTRGWGSVKIALQDKVVDPLEISRYIN